jgi:hypothetical protein
MKNGLHRLAHLPLFALFTHPNVPIQVDVTAKVSVRSCPGTNDDRIGSVKTDDVTTIAECNDACEYIEFY